MIMVSWDYRLCYENDLCKEGRSLGDYHLCYENDLCKVFAL